MYYYKLLLSYDGSRYFGWQTSKEGPTIQSTLEEALSYYLKKPTLIEGASRTDRGVHAMGQVALLLSRDPLDTGALIEAIANILPEDIALWGVEEVGKDFHPSLSAKWKTYQYHLYPEAISSPFYERSAWHIPQPLDLDLMEKAVPLFLGIKDFSAFSCKKRGRERDPYCHIKSIAFSQENPLLKIEITGNRFLYKMARSIVGTLTYIGLKKIPLEALASSFDHPSRPLGMTAPPYALWLKEIKYSTVKDV